MERNQIDWVAEVEGAPRAPHFDGATYEPEQDHERLTTQLSKVRALMFDQKWRTLKEIRLATEIVSDASISARLRDLRKPKFGGYVVERRRRRKGLYEYRLMLS